MCRSLTNASHALLISTTLLLTAACGPSVESVCRDACKKSSECDLQLLGIQAGSSDEEVAICQASCDALQLQAERLISQGQLTQECSDRQVDLQNCIVGLECSQLREENFGGRCADENDATTDACN